MKRILLLIFSTIAISIQAQHVSTVATQKNVLLEDFTGFKCGNCPDGHAYINKIKLAQPEHVFPIGVHAGPYAKTNAVDQPNFIIDEGTTINNYFGIDSYPSGMTNRTDMGAAGLVQGRSYWTMSSRTLTRQTADVNVWVCSTYDKDTRIISTDVELYYTADVPADSSSLCVSLLQSRILGPQAGADMGDEYVHNHVLRAMFTPVWGDVISTSSKGTLVKKHFEYTLPEVIGNIDTDPQHMDVVAYVIAPDKSVMNVNGCEVSCPGMSLPTTATLEAYKIQPVRNNAFPYLECYLVNEGTEPIQSADFVLTLDGEEQLNCPWTATGGNGYEAVGSKQRGYLRIPVEWPAIVIASGCDYKLKLTALNGKTYAGATIKGSIAAMLNVTSDLTVTIKTDRYADDNTFRLLDVNGNEVATYGPYPEGTAAEYNETIHFPEPGTYCFEVTDAWGNGMLSPRGSIKWYDTAGELVASNNDVQNWGYRIFFKYTPATGISTERTDVEDAPIYNLAGQRVAQTKQSRIYIKKGKKAITK